jgi:hypothetical protein
MKYLQSVCIMLVFVLKIYIAANLPEHDIGGFDIMKVYVKILVIGVSKIFVVHKHLRPEINAQWAVQGTEI